MTQKIIVSIFDKKANIYQAISIVRTELEAIRSFSDLVNDSSDKRNFYNIYPDDYELYQLGFFDEETGILGSFDEETGILKSSKKLIITGTQCVLIK